MTPIVKTEYVVAIDSAHLTSIQKPAYLGNDMKALAAHLGSGVVFLSQGGIVQRFASRADATASMEHHALRHMDWWVVGLQHEVRDD